MYHSLTDLPKRVTPDCNVLLDAAFVTNGSARKSIDLLHSLGYSIIIDEMVQRETIRILNILTRELNLTFDPVSRFDEFLRSKPAIFVPPAPQVLGKGVNRADQHVAAAAQHYESWILTGDAPLIVETEKIGLHARFPWDVILEAAAQQGTLDDLRNCIRFVPPAREQGTIFGRLIPGGWAGMTGVGQFTVCDIENIGRIFYDSDLESWIFRIVTGVEARVRYPVTGDTPIAVCGTYSLPGAGQLGKVTIRVGSFPSTSYTSSSKTLTSLKGHETGTIAICHTINNKHHWNGRLRTLVIGPQKVNQETWKALIATREGAPNPYDSNALRHTLRLIQDYYDIYKDIPILSLSIPGF